MKRWAIALSVVLSTLVMLLIGATLLAHVAAAPAASANLAIAHLAPFAMDPGTAVTVTVDGLPLLTDVSFADSTGYVSVTAGVPHVVGIVPAGSVSPALTATLTLTENMDFTAIAVGGANGWPLELQALVDDNTPPTMGTARVRVGHLAPFAATITDTLADVRLQDGTVIVDDVPYGAVSPLYLPLPAGTYDLKVTTADGSVTLIDPMPVTLLGGDIVSLYAVGDGTNQPVGAFAWPAGEVGALLPLAASLRVAHLAPFAMDPGTAVTVTVDGVPLLTGFEFADSTGYVPVEAGVDHLVEIYPAGSPSPALTGTVNLAQAMDYAAIAVGGANGWPLDLLALVDDNTPPAMGTAKVRVGHLAPFAATITDTLADVRLQDGTVIVDDVPYGVVSPLYLPLPAGTYDLKVTTADGSVTLIDPMPVTLLDGNIVSLFAVGDGTNQPVGVFAWPAGEVGALLPLVQSRLYFPVVFKNGAP